MSTPLAHLAADPRFLTLVGAFLVGLFLRWALADGRAFAGTSAAPLYRARRAAAIYSLGFAAVVTLASGAPLAWIPPFAAGLCGAAAFILHAFLDSERPALWHHRRVRPFAVLAVALAGAALGHYLPRPEWAPLFFAALVYDRHRRGGLLLAARLAADLDGVTARSLSLASALRIAAVVDQSPPQPSHPPIRRKTG